MSVRPRTGTPPQPTYVNNFARTAAYTPTPTDGLMGMLSPCKDKDKEIQQLNKTIEVHRDSIKKADEISVTILKYNNFFSELARGIYDIQIKNMDDLQETQKSETPFTIFVFRDKEMNKPGTDNLTMGTHIKKATQKIGFGPRFIEFDGKERTLDVDIFERAVLFRKLV